jgi:Predicted membrane protein (DUF2306)
MRRIRAETLPRVLMLVASLLIGKVTVSVILNYPDYFPPNFGSDFLRGRERYFSGWYHWAFYTHIASGPVSLVLGMILVSERFRLRLPTWHRYLGRIQVGCVLLLVSPSGLWMAYHAAAGPVAGVGLAVLAGATAISVALGWRSAVKRRFPEHRRWMWRCFLLLCSAVVLRLVGGLGTIAGVSAAWFDPLATWMSWLVPLTVFELVEQSKRQAGRSSAQSALTSLGR